MKKLLVLMGLTLILFSGCKKYPEDEAFIHLKRPEKRLKKYPEWEITEYSVNGADSIPYINSKVYVDFALNKITFKLGSGGFSFNRIQANHVAVNFEEKKKKLSIAYAPLTTGYTYPLFLDGRNVWEIKRLDDGIFVIETSKNGKMYRIRFDKA
jgi:hypothetical protein